MNVQFAGVDSVAQYYDKLAQDYDEAVRAWGYCLPETVVELLFKHAKNDLKGPDVTLLDLGCGNGLVGEALCKRHPFNHIVGLDISQKSLDVAQKRGCYLKLQQADLLKKLPVQKESFDFLLCIGTTSYLGIQFFDNRVFEIHRVSSSKMLRNETFSTICFSVFLCLQKTHQF